VEAFFILFTFALNLPVASIYTQSHKKRKKYFVFKTFCVIFVARSDHCHCLVWRKMIQSLWQFPFYFRDRTLNPIDEVV